MKTDNSKNINADIFKWLEYIISTALAIKMAEITCTTVGKKASIGKYVCPKKIIESSKKLNPRPRKIGKTNNFRIFGNLFNECVEKIK